ncbi:MAG: hypothetical protein ABIQ64_03640 [Candidatus Saccharimonadales bacterium]
MSLLQEDPSMNCTKIFLTGLLSLSLVITPALPVAAETNRLPEASEARGENSQAPLEKKRLIALKLSNNKKKVCEKRFGTIKKIMQNAHKRGARQLDVFTTIADRTKAFYEAKQYSVANYDELVATVEDKKQAAIVAVAMSNETIDQFTCDGDDPISIKDLFKAQIQDQNTALKAYKTTIKDLIVAVKSSKSQNATGSSPNADTEER